VPKALTILLFKSAENGELKLQGLAAEKFKLNRIIRKFSFLYFLNLL